MSSTNISSKKNFYNHEQTEVPFHQWPAFDSRYMAPTKSSSGANEGRGVRAVDSRSCRQLYVSTAYTFTRPEKENNGMVEKAKMCFGKVRQRVTLVHRRGSKTYKIMRNNSWRKKGKITLIIVKKVKELSCASLLAMVRRILACSIIVDVVDN